MEAKISRRDFLKIGGVGAAAAAVLTGCGPASRYVIRRPYPDMPEYNQTGLSTYYATTCRECSAGCGLILRTKEGRAIKAEGNPAHPVNRGKICSRGLTAVQGLYNPDRLTGPLQGARSRGLDGAKTLDWDAALQTLNTAIDTNPTGVFFLMGLNSDHLFDLAGELAQALGAPAPLQYSALGFFDGRATLLRAAEAAFGKAAFPYFDLANASLVLSVGANFLETWLSPLAYSRGYGQLRRGEGLDPLHRRGYMIAIEPRLSLTASNADLWLPAAPGAEGLVVRAIGRLAAEKRGESASSFADVDVEAVVAASGVSLEKLQTAADFLADAERPLVIPGGGLAAHANGLEAVQSVFALNALLGNLGQPGGMFLAPAPAGQPASLAALKDLVDRMNAGQVQTLLIHGVNPIFDLPRSLGFAQALENVKTVVSFASFPDETASVADLILPDHTPLESWGYQAALAGSDRAGLSGAQPVVVPLYDTRATADVWLAGGKLPYTDEVEFIQQKLLERVDAAGQDLPTLWAAFLQHGGWFAPQAGLEAPQGAPEAVDIPAPAPAGEGQFHLIPFATQLGDGSGANRPWLQETPDPMTTAMWNTWIEIHPDAAHELGIADDDIVEVTSAAGTLEAIAYLYPAIRPDTVAIPFGQGHTALGRYAENRGANPNQVLAANTNAAGDFAYNDTLVTIRPTGARRPLSRMESRVGVYGDH